MKGFLSPKVTVAVKAVWWTHTEHVLFLVLPVFPCPPADPSRIISQERGQDHPLEQRENKHLHCCLKEMGHPVLFETGCQGAQADLEFAL